MSDYDAFGRKKDESGHDDLGWGATGETPTPTAAPADFTPAQTEFRTVPSSGPPPGRRRWRPGVLLVQFLVLGGIGFGIWLAVDAGRDAAQGVRDTIDVFDEIRGGGSGVDRGDDTVPEQIEPRKLFTAKGLDDALEVLEREVPGKITNFSLRRDAISIQVVRDGRRSIVTFTDDAEVPDTSNVVEAGTLTDTFSYEEINPTALPKLMKGANQRLGKSEADVDYFVVSKSFGTGDVQWLIYYEGGATYAFGDSRGRFIRSYP